TIKIVVRHCSGERDAASARIDLSARGSSSTSLFIAMQGSPPHNRIIKDHEAKAKKVERRRGGRKTRRGTRTELVQGEPRGAGRKVKEFRSTYDFLEEVKERQICKASASSFGPSPCPNARIAATTSSSRFRP